MGRREGGETGRRGDGKVGRREGGETGRWGDGETRRWGDGKVGRREGGENLNSELLEHYSLELNRSVCKKQKYKP